MRDSDNDYGFYGRTGEFDTFDIPVLNCRCGDRPKLKTEYDNTVGDKSTIYEISCSKCNKFAGVGSMDSTIDEWNKISKWKKSHQWKFSYHHLGAVSLTQMTCRNCDKVEFKVFSYSQQKLDEARKTRLLNQAMEAES